VRISIVTPWLDHPELIPTYEAACAGAQIVIVDNASGPVTSTALRKMVARQNGKYIRNNANRWFAEACNQGLAVAEGKLVMMLNNDIIAEAGWLAEVIVDVEEDVLAGPSMLFRKVDGIDVPYLEGWCIVGTRKTWLRLGGFDAEAYPHPYWEDNDLCFRALQMGMSLQKTDWAIHHVSNTTTRGVVGAYRDTDKNRQTFFARVRAARIPVEG